MNGSNLFSDYSGETSPVAYKKKRTIGKFLIGFILKSILFITKTFFKMINFFKLIYKGVKFIYYLPAGIICFIFVLILLLFSNKFKAYLLSSTEGGENQKQFTKKITLLSNVLSFAFWALLSAYLLIKNYL